ncbi:MAG: branched-chain amino acid ABC transporter permease [Acidimicrobiia bacterium]|nr:branched-chain amino acid ABC transporter permease [Acidimicrobiia bacterium]
MDLGKMLIDAGRAALGVPAATYALSAIGLNLQFGYTGLLNFGHVASMLVGAYGVAITVDLGGSLWLGVLVGILLSLVLALLLGVPTLRLRADYLAIVTIAAAEILRLLVRSSWANPLTKSVFGIQNFADSFYDLNPYPDGAFGIGSFRFTDDRFWVMTVAWGLVLLSTFLVWRLTTSPWGRVIKAIREDEDAARSLGKNVFGYKLQSLMVGGAIGALAGMVLAIDQQNVTPDTYQPLLTFYAFTIVILGGAGTLWGPIIGSVIFWFLFEFMNAFMTGALDQGWFGSVLNSADIGPIRFALLGAGLMALMIFRPQGIFGSREEMIIDAG